MSAALSFDPLVPAALLWALAGLTALVLAAGAALGLKGWAFRAGAALVLLAALANPFLVREEREPLPDIAVLLVDESESMRAGNRAEAAQTAAQSVRAFAEADPSLELIEARIPAGQDGTRPFAALQAALAEAPRDRLAGVIAVTDGQAADAPDDPGTLSLTAPLHALLVGDPQADDRRLEIVRAPAFGLVSEPVTFVVRVEDGAVPQGTPVGVTLSVDGGPPVRAQARVGQEAEVRFPISHRGANVVEIAVETGPEELTLVNNRAAVSITGVRDRLRVLLVTGEPHQGARDWRNLLKSDPSVDLVHFTILRPPDKDDSTPIGELALIRFPVVELFVDKLDGFDLIIFDRYQRRGVLPPLYIDNISRYVEDGGALLLAAGPPFSGPMSLYRSPLASVLPVRPTGAVDETAFKPALSETGRLHPVTAPLVAAENDWGIWHRRVLAEGLRGEVLMEGEDGAPLLALDRVGEGRVGVLLSDQAWLWARGYEGGGPYRELFRRVAHWLMKEPELEEERLTARIQDGQAVTTLRTLGAAPETVLMTAPGGAVSDLGLIQEGPGLYRAEGPVSETGLHRFRAGELTAVAAAGALNPAEYKDMRVSDAALRPVVRATGGSVIFAGADGAPPEIRRVRAGFDAGGREWIGLTRNERYRVADRTRVPAAPRLALLALALLAVGFAWRREGR